MTASWVYIRNHGSTGRYRGSYKKAVLMDWTRAIRQWQKEGRDIWCFFDNDVKSAAPVDARRLLKILAGED